VNHNISKAMNYQNKPRKDVIQELLELQKENKKLKELVGEFKVKNNNFEGLLLKQNQRFAKLNKYSIELANQSEATISFFIANEFRSLFEVKEVWVSIYEAEKMELVLEGTTLSENDNSKIVQRFGKSIIGRRTQINKDIYKSMVDQGIGEPSSMYEISFGQIPVVISLAIEKLFSIGWFQGVTLTDKGKLYGGLLIAGYKGQKGLNKDELRTFTEITSNILHRKQVERKLVNSEARFRQLSELLPQLIFEADIQGNVTFINQFGLKLLGYDQKEFQSGLNVNNLLVPDDHSKVFSRLNEVFLGSEAEAREYNVIRKNGEVFPLFLHAEVFTEDGKPEGIRGTGVDISNLRKAEELLSTERNLLRTLINNIPDLIYAKDTQSRFLICNDALVKRMGKENEDQVIGKSDLDLLPFNEASIFFDKEQAIFQSGNPIINSEQSVKTLSGDLKWSLVTKVPFRNRHGEIIGIVGIGRDITVRKLAENEVKCKNEQLQKSIAEKDKFFSIIAHDLRSPFNSFLGFTQMISDEQSSLSKSEIQLIANRMRKSATNLYTLLENLLEWSQMQRGQMDFKPEIFILHQRVKNCVELILGSANAKNIVIHFDIPEKYEIVADKHMFDTVIRNLVSNAIKFTLAGGRIIISATLAENGKVEIRVTDSGIGMNPELLSKLFRLDQQTRRNGTDGEPSTGLGLLLCKEFIEKHNGEIWVESIEKQGSTFYFSLPSGG
jgi:PAS domain S-box-containing protein